MAASDLTTFSAVNAWLGGNQSASTAQISGLITSISRAIYSGLQRPNILPMSYTDTVNGTDFRAGRLLLKAWPVISFTSLYVDGALISPAPPLPMAPVGTYGIGWVLEAVDPSPPGRPQSLYMRGGGFWRGVQNVVASYSAGYQVSETQTIAGGTLTAIQPYGAWASDQGVVYATSGTALTKVASAPAQGQYSVTTAGVYTFNSADNGASVVMSYGYLPADLAQACIEWVALRFTSQKSIGVKSQSLGGQETISYDTGPIPQFVMAAIQPYKRVVMT